MTEKQVVSKEAIVESTSEAVSSQTPRSKGDYTRYFWKNIDRLWSADDYQNARIDELQKKLDIVLRQLNGGA